MDDSLFLWWMPAMLLLTAVGSLGQTRGPWNVAYTSFFGLIVAYLVITFALAGGRPDTGLVLVTATGVLYVATEAIRQRITGLDVFLRQGRGMKGASRAAWVRGRLDRTLRRAADAPAPETGSSEPGEVIIAAALEAGRGDLVVAVRRLDTALDPPEKPPSCPDARLALLLYHRTAYSALATTMGDSPAQSTRWHNDLALARTLLPDVRLGWLADAAVAVAEVRVRSAVYATDALLADARGPWEKGLGAVVGRLAREVPDEYRERRDAHLVSRNPWVAGLATRSAVVDASPGAPA